MIFINVKKDYYAYITVDEEGKKYFDLLKKSFTREVRQFNNYYKYYENINKLHFVLTDNCTTIKVDAGLIPFLCESFDRRKINYQLTDERKKLKYRNSDIQLKLDGKVTLRDYQEESVRKILNEQFGFVKLPTGTGKTEVSASVIKTFLHCYPNEAVLYVVPTVKLKEQAIERFTKYGIKTNDTFPILTGYVNVLCYKSILVADTEKYDYRQRDSIGAFIIDEAHHLSSSKLSKQVHRLHNLRLCLGLSATPFDDEDVTNKLILRDLTEKELSRFGVTGKLVYYMSEAKSREKEFITDVEIHVLTNKPVSNLGDEENDWLIIKNVILKNKERAQRVANYTKHIVQEANLNNVVLLIPEVEWSKQYMNEVYEVFKNEPNTRIVEMYGQGRMIEHTKDGLISLNAESKKQFNKDIANPNIKTIYSATSFFKEGVDIPSIQALINVGGGKGVIPTKQVLGRIVRLFEGKKVAYLHEIKDLDNPVLLKQFEKRMRIYEKDYNAKVKYSSF